MKLTAKQAAFAQAIVSGMNQSDAYRNAYNAGTMKSETIHKKACAVMKVGKVGGRIKELRAEIDKVYVLDTAKLIREAARIAFCQPSRIIGPTGSVLLPSELDADTEAAVASFDIDEFGRVKYKFWDKNSALERLFKHKGLFEIDNKQRSDVGGFARGKLKAMKERLLAKR